MVKTEVLVLDCWDIVDEETVIRPDADALTIDAICVRCREITRIKCIDRNDFDNEIFSLTVAKNAMGAMAMLRETR